MHEYTLRFRVLAAEILLTHTFEVNSDNMALMYAEKIANRLAIMHHIESTPIELWKEMELIATITVDPTTHVITVNEHGQN